LYFCRVTPFGNGSLSITSGIMVSGAARVAVVNETLAPLLVDEGSALGQMIGYEHVARDIIVVAANRVLESLLFEISADDPLTIAAAVFVLAAAACLSGVLPARRAARLDPAVTLRAE